MLINLNALIFTTILVASHNYDKQLKFVNWRTYLSVIIHGVHACHFDSISRFHYQYM